MIKGKIKFIIIALIVFASVIGVTYAFFEYYKVGSDNRLIFGNIYLKLDDGTDNLTISNMFPETIEEARARTDNLLTFTVSGINTNTENDISYMISLEEGETEEGHSRINSKFLVFDLIEVHDDNTEELLLDAMSFFDINSRKLWTDAINRNTTSEITRTYKLRMWLSEDVFISDTNPDADYSTDVFKNSYASVKVSVYGDFEKKYISYEKNYLVDSGGSTSFWPSFVENNKSKIVEVKFISNSQDYIDKEYNNKVNSAIVTDTSKGGNVKLWLEFKQEGNVYDASKYVLHVASPGTIYFPSDCSYMFYNFEKLETITFDNINTEEVTNMNRMFFMCKALKNLDLSDFNTSLVTDMSYMFSYCQTLTSLDVKKFDTSLVTNMTSMFDGDSNLQSLNVENFNTSNVTNMYAMFWKCSKLQILDLSNWDTSKVTNTYAMFQYCSNLSRIYANSDWNTGKVTSSSSMFSSCSNLSGAISYSSSKTNIAYANPTTGYFTIKNS